MIKATDIPLRLVNPKPMIIFCPAKRAKEFADNAGMVLLKASNFKHAFDHLKEGNPIVVPDIPELLSGWEVPEGCVVFFVEGFSTEGEKRIQAEGRFQRVIKG